VILMADSGQAKGTRPRIAEAGSRGAWPQGIGKPVFASAEDCIRASRRRRPSPRCEGRDILCWKNTSFHKEKKRTTRAFQRSWPVGEIWVNARVSAAAPRACLDEGPRP